MTQFNSHRPINSLLLVVMFFASSYGQIRTQQQEIAAGANTMLTGHPKLIKTQHSSEYAEVRCGLQDNDGNLWFGTTGEGAYRFDGRLFCQFTEKVGLNSNIVWSVLEDKNGNIWFGTDRGVCRYDGKTITNMSFQMYIGDRFRRNASPVIDDSTEEYQVWSMLQDKTGRIWFGTSKGVYYYDGSAFAHFLDNDGVINRDDLHLKMVDCILEDRSGNIWFASGMPPGLEGLCRYDGKSVIRFKPGGEGWIRKVLEDENGILWLDTRHNGVWRYDGKTFARFTQKEGIGGPAIVDRAGNIWFGGGENDNGFGGAGGIWCYNGKSFKNFSAKDGMGDYSVWCMIEDRNGDIWIGTRNVGLYRFDGKHFTSYSE